VILAVSNPAVELRTSVLLRKMHGEICPPWLGAERLRLAAASTALCCRMQLSTCLSAVAMGTDRRHSGHSVIATPGFVPPAGVAGALVALACGAGAGCESESRAAGTGAPPAGKMIYVSQTRPQLGVACALCRDHGRMTCCMHTNRRGAAMAFVTKRGRFLLLTIFRPCALTATLEKPQRGLHTRRVGG